jgi:hypothetical protein
MSERTAADAAMAAVEAAAGWEKNPKGNPNAIEKYFDSAVGPKMAVIWIGRAPDQVGNFSVTAEFWSEGRNIAESKGIVLNINTPVEKIPGLIAQFIRKLEGAINDSFAVRLLKS